MNDADRKAFEAWFHGEYFEPYQMEKDAAKDAWQAACEWRDSQVGEPVKAAKYFAVVDLEEKYIQLDVRNRQLEIYEENEFVPRFKNTKIIPVYVTKTPPTAQINQQLVEALECLLTAIQKCHCENSGAAQDMAQAAIQAAREQE